MTAPADHDSRSAASIPWDGVLEVLRGWSGRGQLYSALAASHTDNGDDWNARDVERRARRILFTRAEPLLRRLPRRSTGWLDALPAQSRRNRVAHLAPTGRVDWPATRLQGWPPLEFVATQRHRIPDELLTTTLRWTLQRVVDVRDDAVRVLPGIDVDVRRQLQVMEEVLDLPPVSLANEIRPTRRDLAAVRQNGKPWNALADLTEVLLAEDTRLDELAREMVLPDDDLRWRLFHLGCLGSMLSAVRAAGCTVRWLRPLSAATSGPAYKVLDSKGQQWDLWFEAAATWRHYGIASPYRVVRRALPGAAQPLGADLALVAPGRGALVLECKYSSDPSYVGRNGFEQTLAYMAEAGNGLADMVAGAVVGPDNVVQRAASVDTTMGTLTITSPSRLHEVVTNFLRPAAACVDTTPTV